MATLWRQQATFRPVDAGARTLGRRLGLAAFAVFAGVVPMMPTNELKVDASLGAVMMLAVAAYLQFRGGEPWAASPLDRPAMVLLALATVATVFSVEPFLSLVPSGRRGEGLIMTVAYVLVSVAAARFRRREALVLLIALLAAGVVIGLVAIGQYYGIDVPRLLGFQPVASGEYYGLVRPSQGGYSFGTRAYGTLGNPIFLGGYVVLLLPLALVPVLSASRWRWGYLLSATVLYAALVASQTRAAWVGALVAGAILLFVVVRHPQTWRRAAAMAAIFAVVTAVMVTTRPEATVVGRAAATFRLSDAALAERLYLWKHTLPMIAQRPLLGWGYSTLLGRFPDLGSLEYQGVYGWSFVGIDTPHNEILHVAYSIGLLGLAAYVWFLVRIARSLRRALGRSDVRAAATSLVAGLVGYAVWLQLAWNHIGAANVFWLLGGLAVALDDAREEPSAGAGMSSAPRAAVPRHRLRGVSAALRLRHLWD